MAGNKNSGRKPISDGKVIYLRIPGVLLDRIESERKKESFPRKLSNMILALTSEALDVRDGSN
jgi:hypothetical protein